jgi:prolyl-tRNA synthetase
MKLSKTFTKTIKDYPKDEKSASCQLLIRAGYIDKVAAGIYTLLPLGLRVVNNISNIIRDEMVKVDGQEVLMPGLVPKENWVATGRWDGLDVLFKLEAADEKGYGLGASHEEIVSPLAKKFTLSYKDLPFAIFQIQNKFRNEVRAKSGVLRTREFLMKDLYSFHTDEADLDKYYDRVTEAYWNIFNRCGIKSKTYFTFASGGTFAKYSHEFQTETEAGEDEIYVCSKCNMGMNKEILEGNYVCPSCKCTEYELKKAIEVGNIFKLKTKYSEPFDLTFVDSDDSRKIVQMGCYGIGVQRLMGAVAEVSHDENGLIWPENVSPFKYHLIALGEKNKEKADKFYDELTEKGIEVLYDDRDLSAGEKFADADLIGITNRLVISDKTGDEIELKERNSKESKLVKKDHFL